MMAVILKPRSALHAKRKIWHVLSICVLAFISALVTIEQAVYLAPLMGGGLLIADFTRLHSPKFNQSITDSVGAYMRDYEKNQLSGSSWIAIGAMLIFCFLYFKHVPTLHILTCALLLTAFIDPFASFIGITYGKHKMYNKKSWEGFWAAYALGVFVMLFCAFLGLWRPENIWVGVGVTALTVALVELITPASIDDNLTVPVAASACLYLLG